jgi:catechol 2,3-dioxygenase-like lactoylglutathione lyase family enzyme
MTIPRILRTRWLGAALACTVALLGPAHPASAQPALPAQVSLPTAPAVSAVDCIGITVGDLEKETAFYTGVLGFRAVSQSESSGEGTERLTGVFGAHVRSARLSLGDESIELVQFLAPEGRPIPTDSRSNDRWFQHIAIVVPDMDRAYQHLRAHYVRHASTAPQTLPLSNPNAGGISAFYFKDPEGHVLEVIHFPPGKGDPKWQAAAAAGQEGAGGRLFLGIDHTAIVVASTEASLAFYQGVLGMRIAGTSENFGPEQEHLNNIFGARLRITALRAGRGPGVELLEYLAPGDGRAYPGDARSSDLFNWTTTVVTPSAPALESRFRAARTSWVSPGFLPYGEWPMAAQVRDPDGHALRIVQQSSGPAEAAVTEDAR